MSSRSIEALCASAKTNSFEDFGPWCAFCFRSDLSETSRPHQVMSPSSTCDDKPQMNGGSEQGRPAGDQGRDDAAPRSSREVTARPDSVHENVASGGGNNGGCDVCVEAEPQPVATTSAGNQDFSSAHAEGGAGEDPLLFQGSRPRTDITDQSSTSGGGPAGLGGLAPGHVNDDIRGNVFPQGAFQTPRIRSARSPTSPDVVVQQQPSNIQGV